MKKTILFDKPAREALMRGIDTLADAVSSTLGPKGRNVVVKHSYDVPFSTHDGVTVAKEVFVNDPVEQAGVELVRETATKTNELAGDGTTTSTILARAIIREGLKLIDEGKDAQTLKGEIEKSTERLLGEIRLMATPIHTKEDLRKIATISASDEDLGVIVSEAILQAGKDGVVTLNEVPATDITIEKTRGLSLENGWMSQYFITDDKNNAAIANPYILVTDQKLGAGELIKILDLLPVKNFVVVCEDLDPQALQLLVLNKLDAQKQCHFLAVRAPAYGQRRAEILGDLAAVIGATFISQEAGRSLGSVMLADLGMADRVEASQTNTLFIEGGGSSAIINKRKEHLKKQLETTEEIFDKDLLIKRIAKLSSGVVVINVGGKTLLEMKEKKYRIEDAVNATRAAQEEGIVAGGEITLLKALKVLNPDDLLYKALFEPFKVLMQNAGLPIDTYPGEYPMGVDVTDGQTKNLLDAGIIDPAKVTLSALQNASSIASNVLITQAVIVDENDKS